MVRKQLDRFMNFKVPHYIWGVELVSYSLFHNKGIFGVKFFSTFSVHDPSITEYKFGRPVTDAYHLYETPVT